MCVFVCVCVCVCINVSAHLCEYERVYMSVWVLNVFFIAKCKCKFIILGIFRRQKVLFFLSKANIFLVTVFDHDCVHICSNSLSV